MSFKKMLLVVFLGITSLVYALPIEDSTEAAAAEVDLSNAYYTENYVAKDHSKAEIRDGRGQYGLSYITSNGIEISERGYLKPGENGTYFLVKEGTYKYLDANGTKIGKKFVADERGFVVENL